MNTLALIDAGLILLTFLFFLSIVRRIAQNIEKAGKEHQKLQNCPPHTWEEQKQEIQGNTYHRLFCVKCERYFGDF